MTIITIQTAEDAALDIVLVPGLEVSGQPPWTSTKNSVFWPESLLAPKVPNARILAFNYDKMTIDSFWHERDQISRKSSRLTKELVDVRGAEKDKRPIIFVAHCLGGLVVEDALVRASRNEDNCEIADKTVGLLLLGTPHYSDDSLLKEAKKYFQLVNVNIPPDSKLKAQSSRILEIPRAFEAFRKDRSIRVDTFYADQPISINGEDVYIVEESVAKLQGDSKDPEVLNGNHHEMARFDSENEDFKEVLRSIRQIINKINRQEKPQGETNITFSGVNRGLQVGQNNGEMNGYSFSGNVI